MIALWLLIAAASAQDAPVCADTLAVPQSFQVAWISPVRKRASRDDHMEVIRVGDLRAWIQQEGADQTRLLQGLGLVRENPGRKAEKQWKITIFDITAEQLCRPIDGLAPYTDAYGLPVCEQNLRTHSDGRSDGCGYSTDTATGDRGLDIYRIPWGEASVQGFCVFPLERFIEGA